jgi:cytochrome c oxidase accessory protein FixG
MDIPVKIIVEESDPSASVTGFAPVDLYQKREKIFTRNITGRFQRLRLYTGWPLLLGYLFVPWLSWNDRPLVLLDIPARQFHLGGLTFFPQDFMLLGWLLIIAAFGLFLITSVVGRLWCGYTCPQTIWTSIFMWIEQIAEGTRNQRMRLDRAPWSLDKVTRRTLKHGMWLGWALLTGFTFVAYFVPAPELAVDLATSNTPGWALFWTLFFTGTTYVNAGWMREQVCIHMCPYARFQSAMVDADTLVVS